MEIEYPGPHSTVSFGPRRRYTVEDGTITVPDDRADAAMDALAGAYDVEYTDDGTIAGDSETAEESDETVQWNEDDWMDLPYGDRADAVREGRVDDHLDDIADVETSSTVTDAVEERKDELEE